MHGHVFFLFKKWDILLQLFTCSFTTKGWFMRKHIQGAENEYGILPNDFLTGLAGTTKEYGTTLFFEAAPLCSYSKRTIYRNFFENPSLASKELTWLMNMGRLYVDCGGHPEYATPECLTARDVVIWQVAGDYIFMDIAKKLNEMLWGALMGGEWKRGRINEEFFEDIHAYSIQNHLSPGSDIIRFYRNSIDVTGNNSYGEQENHLVSRSADFDTVCDVLALHRISCILWQGAGMVRFNSIQNRFQYTLSQRHQGVVELVGGQSTGGRKAFILTRDKPRANSRWRRLQIIGGDANMCEIVTRLKYCTTMILILMAENGFFNDKNMNYDRAVLREYYTTFNSDLTFRVCEKFGDANYSSLDIQRMLLEHAQNFFAEGRGEMTDEVQWGLEWWQRMLDMAGRSNAHEELSCYTDCFLKRTIIEVDMKKHGYSWDSLPADKIYIQLKNGSTEAMSVHSRLQYLDLEYHRISRTRGIFYRLFQKNMERVCTDEEVHYAMNNPPPNTRASVRKNIHDWYEERYPAREVVNMTWDCMGCERVEDDTRANSSFILDEPFESEHIF